MQIRFFPFAVIEGSSIENVNKAATKINGVVEEVGFYFSGGFVIYVLFWRVCLIYLISRKYPNNTREEETNAQTGVVR